MLDDIVETFTVSGSHGTLRISLQSGGVMLYEPDTEEADEYSNVVAVDIEEYFIRYGHNPIAGCAYDILDFALITRAGTEDAAEDWRTDAIRSRMDGFVNGNPSISPPEDKRLLDGALVGLPLGTWEWIPTRNCEGDFSRERNLAARLLAGIDPLRVASGAGGCIFLAGESRTRFLDWLKSEGGSIDAAR